MSRNHLECEKDLDLIRSYIKRAKYYINDPKELKVQLDFILKTLNTLLESYDEFIYQERMEDLD